MSRATETVVLCLLVGWVVAEEMTLSINVKKPLAVVSEKFLSVTIDPAFMFSEALSDVEKCTSMAKALAPAYVRIGGPRSNSYVFERGLYPQEKHADPGYTLSEKHWTHVHQWAEKSGLDVIAVIAPQQSDSFSGTRASSWDPRNALDLISFSDHMGYNTSWQLGYECQTRCDVSGSDLGRDVQRLRHMLDAFPRYAEHALIAGPDVVTYKTRLQQQYLQEYFNAASAALSTVTWHPDFASISLEADGVSMHLDGLALEKDSLYRIIGRHVVKKPLWIAESRPEECKHQFLGALVWARRLGNTAKLGVQVLMRQPEIPNFFKPTPDYWVSVLHKMLVGQEVLDTRIATGNRTHVHFYSHCSRPSQRYEPGSITVFGINLTPSKVTASLKGLKLKVVHKYILLPGYDAPNRMFSESTLLNNELLNLIDGKEVPDLKPVITSAERGVKLKLPSGAIGFWVLPGLKMKTCMGHEDDLGDKNLLRRLTKRLDDVEVEEELASEEAKHRPSDLELLQEDRRRLTRQQPGSLFKRLLSRWSNRHREDEHDETGQIRPYRRDLDRLLRRKDYHPIGVKRIGNVGVNEMIMENSSTDAGESMLSKFDDYKRRLADSRKHLHSISPSANKKMDTDKVIEALTLITQVENAMKNLENESLGNKAQVTALNSTTVATNGLTKVTPAKAQGADSIDDVLLVEVLNTDKAKGTTVPVTIEEQIKALYQLLSDEKGSSSLRQKRDINEGQETANIQQRDIQQRKRSKSEELRERRLERLNERRQRMRERLEMRNSERDQQEDEANFYGFQQLPPPKDFPQGDVYLEASNDAKHTDLKTRLRPNEPWARPDRLPDHDDHDYYESLKMRQFGIKENPQGYGEFLDGNALNKDDLRSNNRPFLSEPVPFKEINERPTPQLDNHRPIEQPQQQFVPYFETNRPQEFYELKDPRQFQQPSINFYQPPPPPPPPSPFFHQEQPPMAPMQNFHQEQLPIAPIPNVHQEQPPMATMQNFHPEQPPVAPMQNVHQEQPPMAPIQNFHQERPPMAPIQNFQQEPPMAPMPNFQQERPIASVQNFQQEPPVAPIQNFQQEPPMAPIQNFQQEPPMAPMQNFYPGQPQFYVEPLNYFIDLREQAQNPENFHYRSKRQASNLEDILQREMILQDDNNLRDCQCRVIRGDKDCENCDNLIINEENLSSNAVHQYDMLDNHLPHSRLRRDTEDAAGEDEQVALPTCPSVEDETTESKSDAAAEEEEEEEEDTEEDENAEEEDQEEEGVTEEETKQVSEEEANTAKEVEESTTDITKDYLKPETDSDKMLANRLPRKIGSQLKFFQNTRGSSKAQAKEDSLRERKEAARIAEVSKISTRPNSYEPVSSTEERLAKARSINYSIGQSASTTPAETTIKTTKETTIEKQINSKINTDIGNKNSEVGKQSSIDLKQTLINQRTNNQATYAPVSEDPIKTSFPTSKLKTSSKNSQKTTTAPPESNNKLKNEVEKGNESKRQARLTTRSEALAALRKENESRRVKKMIEASLKMLDSENERFLEYQKRRQDQLERLRMKLRAKREKLLEQYRDELLEAVSQSRDPEERNLYRRDLLQFETPLEAEKSDAEKSSNRPSRSLDDQLQSEIIDEVKEQQDYQSENIKRSPDNVANSFSKFKWRNRYRKRPQVDHLDDESDEYYENEEPEHYYYPYGMYSNEDAHNRRKDIHLQMDYNQRPQQIFDNMHNADLANINAEGNYQYYNVDDYMPIEDVPHNYYSYEVPSHHTRKAKRSSLKHVEIDPAMYEEDEPDYNEQELLMRPSTHISSRTYRHYPHELIDARYKREAVLNDGETLDVPMSISLGLLKSKMKKSKTKPASTSEDLRRRKRYIEDPTQKTSWINKNVKKVYFVDYEDSFKKFPDRSNKKIIKRVIKSINKKGNDVNSNDVKSERRKRSHESNMSRYRLLTDNDIDRSEDSEMDEIWNNIVEMKQDEELLQEYNRHKGQIMQNFWDSQQKLQQIRQTTMIPFSDETNSTNTKSTRSTTQTNIESIFVDAIPKLETVITGGIKKAQNLTGSLEDFIVTFDDQFEETTAFSSNSTGPMESEEASDGRLSHNLFKAVVANVKRFFGMVSGLTKIFHGR